MSFIDNLIFGFETAATLTNFFYCFAGVFLGTMLGVIPGIGPLAGIALLLPFTFQLPPETALIMLAGIYYGGQYGNSTAAILMKIPGDVTAIVTCIEGYELAKQGRAGPALGIAGLASLFAGIVATIIIAAFSPLLSTFALRFGAAEYFSLMVLGLVMSAFLSQGSAIKALGMVVLGLLLGVIGTDVQTGTLRMTFGFTELFDGVNIVAVAVGVYGFGTILEGLEKTNGGEGLISKKISHIFPTLEDIRHSVKPAVRGTGIGAFCGVLPGAGGVLATFIAYAVEKRLGGRTKKFGNGAIEGVAAPEAANNAAAQTAFIPMLTLGIPGSATKSIIMVWLFIQGIQPGPQIITDQPALFWGLVVSMLIGNFLLIILNLPLIGMWVRLLLVPFRILAPLIVLLSCIGVYSINNNAFDVYMAAFFGLLGYIFIKFGLEAAPMLLGFVLGPLMEENLRRTMTISGGDFSPLLFRPISGVLLGLAFLILTLMFVSLVRRRVKV